MDWSLLLQKVLEVILPFLATALTGWLVAQARLAWGKFSETKPDLAWALEQAAKVAVGAAEQMKIAELIDNKKKYALGIAENWLLAQGIKVDVHLIEAAIEAAVGNMNKEG